MDTTRKIPKEELIVLEEIQLQLKKRGVETTQKQLLVEGIKLLAENKDTLVLRLKKRRNNTKEKTERFLKIAKAHQYDFGDNWLEEIDTTL